MLDWFNTNGFLPRFATLTIIERDGYGWCNFIEHHISSRDDIDLFYYQSGALLCLLYLLGATDIHHENTIASKEGPVVVDCETLLSPIFATRTSKVNKGDALDSVLRTCFLPRLEYFGNEGSVYNIGAISNGRQQETSQQSIAWKFINSDAMQFRPVDSVIPPERNSPIDGMSGLTPRSFKEQIISGFADLYHFILSHTDELLSRNGPLRPFHHENSRVLIRSTRIYGALIESGLVPELLKDGIRFGLRMDSLAQAYLENETRPALWPLLREEIRAVENLDVPLFHAQVNTPSLKGRDGVVMKNAFVTSSYRAMRRRFRQMNPSDLKLQLELVEATIDAAELRSPAESGPSWTAATAIEKASLMNVLVERARQIGDLLVHSAIDKEDERLTWIGLGYIQHADRYDVKYLGNSLYDGNIGIALFMGALFQVTGEEHYREISLRCLTDSLTYSHLETRTSSRSPTRSGLGVSHGVGSTLYGLTKCRELTGFGGIEEVVVATASKIADATIRDDRRFDILGGVAGCLIGLLAAYHIAGDQRLLDKAIACGNALLRNAESVGAGEVAWRTISPTPLCGFSHGASGIALALTRLNAVTGDIRFWNAAMGAVRFERRLFSPEKSNWPDLRFVGSGADAAFPVKWCHGAAGITMARVSMHHLNPEPMLQEDVLNGLVAVSRGLLQESDNLCCGNLGRIDALLLAHRHGFGDHLEDDALCAAFAVVSRSIERDHFILFPDAPNIKNPGFFQGLAGIGYELLRLTRPDLPSVLTFE